MMAHKVATLINDVPYDGIGDLIDTKGCELLRIPIDYNIVLMFNNIPYAILSS